MGTDHSHAKYDAEAFCKVTSPNPDCKSYYSACDVTTTSVSSGLSTSTSWYQTVIEGFLAPVRENIGKVQAWWTEDVTTFTLVVLAAFLVLAAGLAYAVFKLRQLRHMIAKLNSPAKVNDPAHVLEEDITKTVQETFPRTIPEPSKEPKLDTKAVKEAFKSRRQEFEV